MLGGGRKLTSVMPISGVNRTGAPPLLPALGVRRVRAPGVLAAAPESGAVVDPTPLVPLPPKAVSVPSACSPSPDSDGLGKTAPLPSTSSPLLPPALLLPAQHAA